MAPTATPGFLATEGTEIELKDTHNDDRETMIDNEGGHDKKKKSAKTWHPSYGRANSEDSEPTPATKLKKRKHRSPRLCHERGCSSTLVACISNWSQLRR